MLISRLFVGAGVLFRGALSLSPPYTTPAPECRVGDPKAACPTYANCYNIDSGCTSSGCPGGCAPISSCTMGSPNRTCEVPGQTCTPFYTTCTTNGCFGACIDGTSPTPTCTPTPTPSSSSLRGCKIGDLTSTCSPADSYTCTPTSPCTTTGCGGLCLSLSPSSSLRGCKIGDLTSTCSPADSYTCTPTSPCTSTGCAGLCISTGGGGGGGGTSPSPTEPPLKTRTYDCLVSVTAQCLPGYNCEPWYGQCCNSLNCPGRCVKQSSDCRVETKEVLVTTTVTVWHSEHGHGN